MKLFKLLSLFLITSFILSPANSFSAELIDPKSADSQHHHIYQSAKNGETPSRLKLANLYYEGVEAPKNMKEAIYWFEKASQNYPEAMLKLAIIYYLGEGTKQDYKKALNLFQKLAIKNTPHKGDMVAQYYLAQMHLNGEGTNVDNAKGISYLEKSAEQGYLESIYKLGRILYDGKITAQNYTQAFKLISKAANQGMENALFTLGIMYENGQGTNVDYLKALECYTKAFPEKGERYENLISALYAKEPLLDNSHALHKTFLLAENGSAKDQIALAFAYQHGLNIEQNTNKAIEWYTKAVNQNNAEAQHSLGSLYLADTNTENDKLAFDLISKSANQGLEIAIYSLAFMYRDGLGTEKNLNKAIKTYEVLSKKGDPKAYLAIAKILYLADRTTSNNKNLYINYTIAKDLAEANTDEDIEKILNLMPAEELNLAQFSLGQIYADKSSIIYDEDKKLAYYALAAKNGHREAKNLVKELYKNEPYSNPDSEQYQTFLLAEEGNAKAQYELGLLYWEDNELDEFHSYTREQKKKALEWIEKSANQNYVEAQIKLGDIYLDGEYVSRDENRIKIAVEWYEKAANKGNTEAQYKLAERYYRSYDVKNHVKALSWYEKSANQGNVDAQFRAGYMYHSGEGTVINYTKAFNWYTKSANQGHAVAYNNLGVMYADGHGRAKNNVIAYAHYSVAGALGDEKAKSNMNRIFSNLSTQQKKEAQALAEKMWKNVKK